LKPIAIYQILGGTIGIFLLLTIDYSNLSQVKILTCFFALTLYSLSIYSGVLLLKNQILKGINLSIILNLFQIISFAVLGFSFKFVSGICLGINIDLTDDTLLRLNFDITNFQANFWGGSRNIFIGINFVPLFILSRLFKNKELIINTSHNRL